MDYEAHLKQNLDEAIANNDGYLAHHWGSALEKLWQVKRDSERRLMQNKIKLIGLKYFCEQNSLHKMITYTINSTPRLTIFTIKNKRRKCQESLDIMYRMLEESQENYFEKVEAIKKAKTE